MRDLKIDVENLLEKFLTLICFYHHEVIDGTNLENDGNICDNYLEGNWYRTWNSLPTTLQHFCNGSDLEEKEDKCTNEEGK